MQPESPALISFRRKEDRRIQQVAPQVQEHRGIPYPVRLRYAKYKEDAIRKALSLFRSGCCVLWIENTVKEAQRTYENLLHFGKMNGGSSHGKVGLIHSRFTGSDRQKNEKSWTEKLGKDKSPEERRADPCILVGTQVCEQSLDICSDVLFSSVCPIDFLIQRIGRVWRHRKFDCVRPLKNPEAVLFGMEGQTLAECAGSIDSIRSEEDLKKLRSRWKSLSIYDPYYMGRTLDTLIGRSSLRIPEDIRSLLEETYA